MSKPVAVILLISGLTCGPAVAYDAAPPHEQLPQSDEIGAGDAPTTSEAAPGWGLADPRTLGLGFAYEFDAEPSGRLGGANTPFPVHSYRGERFAATGPSLSYLLFGAQRPWSFKTILSPSFDATELEFLRGLDDREITTEGGFEASYRTDLADVSLSTRNDLLSEHDGYRVDAGISRSWWLGRFMMTPEISYSYWDADRSDYYFGVRSSEAAPGRRAYDLDGTGNWGLSLMGFTNLTPQWFMLAGAKYTYYDEDIEDSPIVDKYYSYKLFLGFGYKFGDGSGDDRPDVDFDRQP